MIREIKNININPEFYFDLSFFTVFFVFLIFMFSEIGFLFNFSLNAFCTPLSLSLSIAVFAFLKKKTLYDKKKLFLSFFLIFVLSFIFSVLLWDSSWDGRTYHQYAIISLKNGWNPVYDNVLNTDIYKSMFWEKFYPKFCEITSANFVLLFNNIESGKIINWFLGSSLFFASLFVLSKFKNLSNTQILFFAILVCLNPVLICQISTYYIDFIVYILFCLLIFSMFLIERAERESGARSTLFHIFFIMNLVLLSATKTIGLFYVPLFLIVYFLYCKGYKNIKKYILITILTLFLVLITMVNPYFTNLKQGHHMLYPLAGEHKVDILTGNRPERVRNSSHLIRTAYGIFAIRSGYNCADSRVGGFGPLWGMLFVLMLWFLTVNRSSVKEYLKDKGNREKYLLLFILLTVFLNPENWWARYVPQFWLLPLFICAIFLNNKELSKKAIRFLTVFLWLLFINSLIVFIFNFCMTVRFKGRMTKAISANKGEEIIFYCANNECIEYSFFERLKEKKIRYKIADEEFYKNNEDKFKPLRVSLGENISRMER